MRTKKKNQWLREGGILLMEGVNCIGSSFTAIIPKLVMRYSHRNVVLRRVWKSGSLDLRLRNLS